MRAAPTTMDLRLAPSAELGVARLLDWPGGAGHEPAAGADLVRAAGADPAESTAGDGIVALVESGAGPVREPYDRSGETTSHGVRFRRLPICGRVGWPALRTRVRT